MTEFTKRTTSPFRFDIVGSFLRPKELKEARAKYQVGQITKAELTAIEDKTIIDLIKKEEAAGLHAVTDGEFRRSWWHLDFIWGLEGIEQSISNAGYEFHDETTRAETAKLVGKVSGNNHPFVEHFKFTRDHVSTGTQIKQTIPSPAQAFFEFLRPENIASVNKYYPSFDAFAADLVTAYRQVIADLYAAGCRTLQLDDCTWSAYADFAQHPEHIKSAGFNIQQLEKLEETSVELNNAIISDQPHDLTINTHDCRGNYHSTWAATGGYGPVADPLFTKENVTAFYLEYDTERAGGFEPLEKVPNDKYVVLGLVTSKSGQLEDREAIINRIHEAAKFHPLDKLCLSPQCGFASTEEGNILTEKQQWAKIALIKDIAKEVWG